MTDETKATLAAHLSNTAPIFDWDSVIEYDDTHTIVYGWVRGNGGSPDGFVLLDVVETDGTLSISPHTSAAHRSQMLDTIVLGIPGGRHLERVPVEDVFAGFGPAEAS